jgi:hypothetical protein
MSKKLTTEEFIERARKVHGDRYDYSLVEYKGTKNKVRIICKDHGIFEQTPDKHLFGRGCSMCNGGIRITKSDFINKAKKIHGNKYDYSLVKYKNNITKVIIICPKHGKFRQTTHSHLQGSGCPYCAGLNKDNNMIKEQFREVHGNMYDYSLVEYMGSHKKVKIICKKHGVFEQTPNAHYFQKQGCPKCIKNRKMNTEIFINKAKKIHGDKYDYSLVKYKNNITKVIIICPKHGEFKQTPSGHLKGRGCSKCSKNKKLNTEDFIKIAKKIHVNTYDYSLVKYKNHKTKIKIICHKHGLFEQSPNKHLRGQGCPKCKTSKGENEIIKYLDLHNINYIKEKKFDDCKYKSQLPFDFYLPNYNMCIEYDGIQHFKSIQFWGGKKGLKERQKRDKIKNEYCSLNNIRLIRIRYDEEINLQLKVMKALLGSKL